VQVAVPGIEPAPAVLGRVDRGVGGQLALRRRLVARRLLAQEGGAAGGGDDGVQAPLPRLRRIRPRLDPALVVEPLDDARQLRQDFALGERDLGIALAREAERLLVGEGPLCRLLCRGGAGQRRAGQQDDRDTTRGPHGTSWAKWPDANRPKSSSSTEAVRWIIAG
jgi:hypothetical protein